MMRDSEGADRAQGPGDGWAASAVPRRGFLAALAAGSAASLLWPREVAGLGERLGGYAANGARRGAGVGAAARGAESGFWETVRGAFLLAPDRIYLNVGTLGAQPRVVVDAVVEHTRRVAETHPPAVDWDGLKDALGHLLNGDPAGFVFPRNTTEGMSFVANGLELTRGDEIVTTDHEHIGGRCPWELVAARHGATLRLATLPVPAADPGALADAVWSMVTPRTRVLSVSHVTFTNGTVLPVAELAARCRARDIVCVVDGAHPPGLMPVDLRAMGADFYASSPHKWLLAPQGTGLLWMAERWRTELWPTLASGGWNDLSLGAHRFNHLGTLDESRLAGLVAALAFLETIGFDTVHARIRTLRRRLYEGLAATPGVTLHSVAADGSAAGMVSFTLDGVEGLELQRRLGGANVRTRVISEGGRGWMRLSPHVYVLEEEIDRVVEMVAAAAGAS